MSQYFSKKGGAALIYLSNPPVNGLAHKVRTSLVKDLERAVKEKAPAVVLMGSGNHFSAGADIVEFARGGHLTTPSLTEVIEYMDSYNTPLVASVHGSALGGGLETALACHWRVANASAVVGLPEVKLGILPGAGGTQRLPRLTGVAPAVDIMTSGRMLSAKDALQIGIIDKLFSEARTAEDLADAAVIFALSEEVLNTPLSQRRVSSRAIPGDASEELFKKLWQEVTSKARGTVAPLSILKAVQAAVTYSSFQDGLKKERELFVELMRGPQARALQYFFFSERRSGNLPEELKVDPAKIKKIKSVGIIGGGTMGCGIAISCVNAGLPVTLLEVSTEKATKAVQSIEKIYKSSSAFKSGKMTEDKLSKMMSTIKPTIEYKDLSTADIVIEAGFEDMKVKKEIFTKLDSVAKADAILATNTSYLDIDEIASVTKRPSSVIGAHFFSPANVMQLLEVIRGKETSKEVIQSCMTFGKNLKKIPVLAGNCHGFIGNRMIDPLLREAQHLVEEGATPAQVDRVLKQVVGMAMGPFEVSDLAGIDIGWKGRKELTERMVKEQGTVLVYIPPKPSTGDATGTPGDGPVDPATVTPSSFSLEGVPSMVPSPNAPRRQLLLSDWYSALPELFTEKGMLGQKTKNGFYSYNDPKNPRKPSENPEALELIAQHRKNLGIEPREISDQEIVERCIYPLVNEGLKILEEGIALRPEDIDIVYIYGYGFPSYRGGPLFYAEQEIGFLRIYRSLRANYDKLHQRPWFKPAQLLEAVVEGDSNLREEMYFRKINAAKKHT